MGESLEVKALEPLRPLPDLILPTSKPIIMKQKALAPLVVTKVKKIKVRQSLPPPD